MLAIRWPERTDAPRPGLPSSYPAQTGAASAISRTEIAIILFIAIQSPLVGGVRIKTHFQPAALLLFPRGLTCVGTPREYAPTVRQRSFRNPFLAMSIRSRTGSLLQLLDFESNQPRSEDEWCVRPHSHLFHKRAHPHRNVIYQSHGAAPSFQSRHTYHHRSLRQQLAVVWSQHLTVGPEGPTLISRTFNGGPRTATSYRIAQGGNQAAR